jgi:hypothetical protein
MYNPKIPIRLEKLRGQKYLVKQSIIYQIKHLKQFIMKKTLFLLLAVVAVSLFSCGGSTNDPTNPTDNTSHTWTVDVTNHYVKASPTAKTNLYDSNLHFSNGDTIYNYTDKTLTASAITGTKTDIDSIIVTRYGYGFVYFNKPEIVYNGYGSAIERATRTRTYTKTIVK